MKHVLLDAKSQVDDTDLYENLENFVDELFHGLSLCGPRMFISPGSEETNACEIFFPYDHDLKTFSDSRYNSNSIFPDFSKSINKFKSLNFTFIIYPRWYIFTHFHPPFYLLRQTFQMSLFSFPMIHQKVI